MLDQELNRLPAKYRAPLVLCYLKGQTHDQAAEELGCPVGTVRSRLSRGRDLLRRRLTRRGYAPTAAILGRGWDLPAQARNRGRPSGLDFVNGRCGLGDRRVQNDPRRRGRRVGPGLDSRSAHDHETRSAQMDRNDDPGNKSCGRRSDRRRLCRGPEPERRLGMWRKSP